MDKQGERNFIAVLELTVAPHDIYLKLYTRGWSIYLYKIDCYGSASQYVFIYLFIYLLII